MATEIRLEQESMGMHEATVVEWLKREGERVEVGEAIVEVEAEKANFEITSPVEGVLLRTIPAQGASVQVRGLLAVVGEPGEQWADDATTASISDSDAGRAASPSGATARGAGASATRVPVEPRARRLALDAGIDLAGVNGTGPGGRITEADVEAAVAAGPAPAAGAASPPPASASPGGLSLPGLRGTIARRMMTSLTSMAQFSMSTEADVTELVRTRDEIGRAVRPSFNHLMIRAVALALREHPQLNARVEQGEVVVVPEVHVGLAVALDAGLVVAVVRDVHDANLDEIARRSKESIDAVSSGRLSPELVSGSTFTISNLGSFGIDSFTPIVNPPEVAILGVGRTTERAVRSGDGIAWRTFMGLSLTVDHRIIDGAPGAAFLQTLVGILSDPAQLFEEPPAADAPGDEATTTEAPAGAAIAWTL
jgi:pyruvate dehydrogenase E2 component (dihydrolipoamide acetyltransferase)